MKKGILVLLMVGSAAHAGLPVWRFTPIDSPVISVSATGTASVRYTVTNNSKKPHQLVLSSNTPAGISQVGGACVLAGLGSTCTLTLNINGSALPSDNVSGGPILCQSNSNGTPNANQCYQPSPGDSLVITRTYGPILTASVSQLALSVYDPANNAALTGISRQITITNTGSTPAANLNVTATGLPYPTNITTIPTTCTSSLLPGATCTITVTPGATASLGAGNAACTTGIAPTPGVITVSASNVATPVTTNVVVLGYSCIYQGGYVYAVDDTTPITGSVGGKVVTTSDQASPYPNGIVWSSNGESSTSPSYDSIPGIDQASTSATGSPTYDSFSLFFSVTYTNINPFTSASFAMCNGALDGSCNTGNILTFYNQFITNNTQENGGTPPFTASAGPTNITYYAAGRCTGSISGYTDWYLPAICEMGPASNYSGCSPSTQNIVSQLPGLIGDPNAASPSTSCAYGANCLAAFYWSSTEYSGDSQLVAWVELFASGGSNQIPGRKNSYIGVRCSRALTL